VGFGIVVAGLFGVDAVCATTDVLVAPGYGIGMLGIAVPETGVASGSLSTGFAETTTGGLVVTDGLFSVTMGVCDDGFAGTKGEGFFTSTVVGLSAGVWPNGFSVATGTGKGVIFGVTVAVVFAGVFAGAGDSGVITFGVVAGFVTFAGFSAIGFISSISGESLKAVTGGVTFGVGFGFWVTDGGVVGSFGLGGVVATTPSDDRRSLVIALF